MKIIYTQAGRTETLASSAVLRRILERFVHRRVFYEMSSRHRGGNVFFSTKNRFVVGSIEVVNRTELLITIFDRDRSEHSIELQNPATMRVYEEPQGGFAVAFVCEPAEGVEVRCYLRDEGPEDDTDPNRSELEQISLPELFEYLEGLTNADALSDLRFSLEELVSTPAHRSQNE